VQKPTNFQSTNNDKVILTWLSRGYVLALTLLIILTLFSHYLTSRVIAQEIIGAEISFALSNQITHINQVGHYATIYYKGKEELDFTLMTNAINNMNSSYNKIMNYIDNEAHDNSGRENLKKSMRSSLSLETRLQDFIKSSDEYLKLSTRTPSNNPETASKEILEVQRSLKKITDDSNGNLIKLLQLALADYQENQILDIKKLHELQLYLTFGMVFIILLEALCIFRPLVKKIEKSQLSLIKQALEDPLTELKNRRAFTKDFDSYNQSLERKKEKYVLAVCDLDKFKSVNDTYGHDVGDLVLKHFSSILKKTLRPSDVIARMGGEEFVILLTNTNAATAQKILDRLRQITEKNPCPLKGKNKGKTLSFTTSIGYAEGPIKGDGVNMDTYIKLADKALYKAKEGGRNMVVNGREIEEKDPTL
jgi:diguanylate cyclase (GGDEF)-like protein